MEATKYWDDIDTRLKLLVKNGYVKLPSLKLFELGNLASEIISEMGGKTFTCLKGGSSFRI
tara:strand:- start:317 stop:499 length:183 start_codon:yes stop_codon:yes gene_type:complete